MVDAGNSLLISELGPKEPAERTRGKTSIEILNSLGYDAVALGEKDLILTREELTQRLAEAKDVPFVSANLIDKSTGKLFAKPYVIKDIAGHRVALIGLTSGVPEGNTEFTVIPALDAARDYVTRLQSQADIIILLSNVGAEANKVIGQVPGVDLVVSGGQDPLPEPAEPAPGTLVVQAEVSSPGHAGRHIGRLNVTFDESGKVGKHTWESVELGPTVGDDPAMADWVSKLPQP